MGDGGVDSRVGVDLLLLDLLRVDLLRLLDGVVLDNAGVVAGGGVVRVVNDTVGVVVSGAVPSVEVTVVGHCVAQVGELEGDRSVCICQTDEIFSTLTTWINIENQNIYKKGEKKKSLTCYFLFIFFLIFVWVENEDSWWW